MSETPSINPSRAHSARSIARVQTEGGGSAASDGVAPGRSADQLELSSRAVLLSRLRALPAIREDLVQRVRSEIDEGAYETAEKVEAAVGALAEELASSVSPDRT